MREQLAYPGRAGMVPSLKNEKRPAAQLIACLYFGFVLTGIGTTLLGCILPALSGIWNLNDSHAGFLIAAQFAGSSCGALLARSRLYTTLIRGYLLLAVSAVSIAFCHGYFAAPLLFCFGLGLGSAMTSTSMIIAGIYSATRGASLSLLNAFWGLGAVLCPPLVTAWEHFHSSPSLYLGMAVTAMLPLILLAAVVGALVGILLIAVGGRGRSTPIPFGPFLAGSGYLMLLFGHQLTNSYLGLLSSHT